MSAEMRYEKCDVDRIKEGISLSRLSQEEYTKNISVAKYYALVILFRLHLVSSNHDRDIISELLMFFD